MWRQSKVLHNLNLCSSISDKEMQSATILRPHWNIFSWKWVKAIWSYRATKYASKYITDCWIKSVWRFLDDF